MASETDNQTVDCSSGPLVSSLIIKLDPNQPDPDGIISLQEPLAWKYPSDGGPSVKDLSEKVAHPYGPGDDRDSNTCDEAQADPPTISIASRFTFIRIVRGEADSRCLIEG